MIKIFDISRRQYKQIGVLQLNLVESALTAWSKPCLNPALVLKGMLDNDTTEGHKIVKMLRDALAI